MPKLIHSQKIKLNAGFTLVELMVTVGVIAIVAGLTFGNLNSTSYRLKGTAKTLKANMQKARLLAVKENCPVYVDFDLEEPDDGIDNKYTIWKDLNDNGTCDDATTDNNGDGAINSLDEELIETVPLPSGISFGTVANANGGPAVTPAAGTLPTDGVGFPDDGINKLRFSPQGTSSNGNAYLYAPANNEAGTHAVGTNNIGRVRSFYFATEGGGWN